jgi:hypothetical protein
MSSDHLAFFRDAFNNPDVDPINTMQCIDTQVVDPQRV